MCRLGYYCDFSCNVSFRILAVPLHSSCSPARRRVTVVPESKAPGAIVTPCGTVIDAREEHPLKAISPIVVTLFGRVIDVREEHPSKAYFPIVVTLFVC